ncbi:flagellar basal body-associated FliL family protein [Undibacterium piscinae]|jgi:flagellar basal body-associated protein FliL|uniref:Flagellar protein FliL n=1 Tax=Undibacterium piscinae TaxID=2495591 RepID=A0A6M4A3T7_9BURK|nr:flagellar basal body-associated FliL family protein [Undibacterium piscinae]
MSNAKSKGELLTSTLDFERIDVLPATGQQGAVVAPESAKPVEQAAKPKVNLSPPKKMEVPLRSRQAVLTAKKDRLTLYIAGFVMAGMIVMSYAIYLYTKEPYNPSGLSYVALPQMIINMDGNVARLQVSVQIDMADADWLKQHKNEVDDIFRRTIAARDPDQLRTQEGFAEAQQALKEELNEAMASEKIQAVLLTELLIQGKDE